MAPRSTTSQPLDPPWSDAAVDSSPRRVPSRIPPYLLSVAQGFAVGIPSCALLFALSRPTFHDGLVACVTCLAMATAAVLAGVLMGFLFAIPRTGTAAASDVTNGSNVPDNPHPNGSRVTHLPNTNLEQISDWLTKMMVGLGLTQLGKLPGAVRELQATLVPVLGTGSGPFGIALVAASLTFGFVAAYLFTRLVISTDLYHAESRLEEIAEDVRRTTKKLESNAQEIADVRATALGALARTLVENGLFEQAIAEADRALAEDPNLVLGYIEKARALKRLGRLDDALASVNAGLGRWPDHGKLLFNRACYRTLLGHSPDDIRPDLERALAQLPFLKSNLRTDPDFDGLRNLDLPWLRALIE